MHRDAKTIGDKVAVGLVRFARYAQSFFDTAILSEIHGFAENALTLCLVTNIKRYRLIRI